MSSVKAISIEAHSDDGESYPTVTFTENPQIEDGLPPSQRILNSPLWPYKRVRMDQAHDGLEKPLWLMADIRRDDLCTGEPESPNMALVGRILKRGIWQSTTAENDQCGHIVGDQMGGTLIEINLFPQNKSLNKGWKNNFMLWKFLNYLIKKWVTLIPERFEPHVEYQMRLYYGDSMHPDRPDSFKYSVGFFMRDDEDRDHETQKRITLTRTILNISLRAVQTMDLVNIKAVRKDIEDAVQEGNMGGASEFQDLKREIVALLSTKPTPRPKKMSILDFIPVVGSVKGMAEGCKDLLDGNYVSGGVNLALGAGGLGMDFMFLGGAGMLRNAGTILIIESAKPWLAASCALKYFKRD